MSNEPTLDIEDDIAIERSDVQSGAASTRGATRRGARSGAARDPARSPARAAGVVLGRNGEELSRKRTSTKDIFDVPQNLIPDGWEYQWCAVTVTGNSEILMDQNLMMAENGWRPVPADRHQGRFMPVGHTGSIIRGGQMLMERPKQLCEEARNEDVRNAKQLISDRNDALKLSGVKKALPDGFQMSNRYRGTGGDMRMSIDPALDIPMPQHQLAEAGE
jgi:hypothetical protein